MLERFSGVTTGQHALLSWIDAWLAGREVTAKDGEPGRREGQAGSET
jgi:hypothetical protein